MQMNERMSVSFVVMLDCDYACDLFTFMVTNFCIFVFFVCRKLFVTIALDSFVFMKNERANK